MKAKLPPEIPTWISPEVKNKIALRKLVASITSPKIRSKFNDLYNQKFPK